MARVFIFLTLASMLLTAAALISVLSVEDKRRIRGLPRLIWVILILFVPIFGSIGYFMTGRPLRPQQKGSSWGKAFRKPPRPSAPDDDPDFLRSLDGLTSDPGEQEFLRRLEDELKDDERRRRDPGAEG